MNILSKLLGVFALLVFQTHLSAESFRPASKLWYLKSSFDNGTEYILLGTTHMSGETENPQVKDIEDIFSFFNPDAVILEGGQWTPRSNKNEAMACCGEMGLAAYLANNIGANILTWDPTSEEELAHFITRYPEPLLELYYFLRLLQQMSKTSTGLSQKEVLKLTFEKNEKSYNLLGYPHSVEDAQALLSLLFNGEYLLTDFADFDRKITEKPLIPLKSIKTEINSFRDTVGIEKVKAYSKTHKRLLIIMGKDHFRNFMDSFIEKSPLKKGSL